MNNSNPVPADDAATPENAIPAPPLRLEFAGEWWELPPESPFIIGRGGDLEIDDNPYLHRHFLELRHKDEGASVFDV